MESEMYIAKYFTLNEIDLLLKMCAVSLASDNFNEKEKEDINNILENTLV